MNPPTLTSSDSQLVDWIREHCHCPGVIGFAFCQADQTVLATSFDNGFPEKNLHEVWPAAVRCMTAVRQQGGPAREFLWQGRQRSFWIAVRSDGACLGLLHEKALGADSRKALEAAIDTFQGMPAASER